MQFVTLRGDILVFTDMVSQAEIELRCPTTEEVQRGLAGRPQAIRRRLAAFGAVDSQKWVRMCRRLTMDFVRFWTDQSEKSGAEELPYLDMIAKRGAALMDGGLRSSAGAATGAVTRTAASTIADAAAVLSPTHASHAVGASAAAASAHPTSNAAVPEQQTVAESVGDSAAAQVTVTSSAPVLGAEAPSATAAAAEPSPRSTRLQPVQPGLANQGRRSQRPGQGQAVAEYSRRNSNATHVSQQVGHYHPFHGGPWLQLSGHGQTPLPPGPPPPLPTSPSAASSAARSAMMQQQMMMPHSPLAHGQRAFLQQAPLPPGLPSPLSQQQQSPTSYQSHSASRSNWYPAAGSGGNVPSDGGRATVDAEATIASLNMQLQQLQTELGSRREDDQRSLQQAQQMQAQQAHTYTGAVTASQQAHAALNYAYSSASSMATSPMHAFVQAQWPQTNSSMGLSFAVAPQQQMMAQYQQQQHVVPYSQLAAGSGQMMYAAMPQASYIAVPMPTASGSSSASTSGAASGYHSQQQLQHFAPNPTAPAFVPFHPASATQPNPQQQQQQ